MRFLKAVLSVIIVFTLNSLFIIIVAFSTETPDINAVQVGTFNNVVFQDNTVVTPKDYGLLNWGYGDVKTSADEAFSILETSKYEKVSFVEQVIIQLLQNRFNSVIMLLRYPTYTNKTDNYKLFQQAQGTASRVFLVKYFYDYYLILEYIEKDSVTDSNKFGNNTTAVYKAISPDNIVKADNLKTKKTHYTSYSFYPISLAKYVATPFSKIVNISVLLLETLFVYHLLLKHKYKFQTSFTHAINEH